MRRPILITVLAVLGFGTILLARLPARWVIPGPPADVACASVDGTLWNGACTGLIAHGQPIGDVTWEIHASRLLAGKLNASLTLTRPKGIASGLVEVGLDKSITARDVQIDMPLDRTLSAQLPPDLRGTVHAQIALASVTAGGVIKVLQGTMEARDLEQGAGNGTTSLGGYSLVFPAAASGDPTGQLRDLGGGPLELKGTLRLTPEPGFDLQGAVKARAGAPADLVQQIRFLGSPDAEGWRPLAMSMAF